MEYLPLLFADPRFQVRLRQSIARSGRPVRYTLTFSKETVEFYGVPFEDRSFEFVILAEDFEEVYGAVAVTDGERSYLVESLVEGTAKVVEAALRLDVSLKTFWEYEVEDVVSPDLIEDFVYAAKRDLKEGRYEPEPTPEQRFRDALFLGHLDEALRLYRDVDPTKPVAGALPKYPLIDEIVYGQLPYQEERFARLVEALSLKAIDRKGPTLLMWRRPSFFSPKVQLYLAAKGYLEPAATTVAVSEIYYV